MLSSRCSPDSDKERERTSSSRSRETTELRDNDSSCFPNDRLLCRSLFLCPSSARGLRIDADNDPISWDFERDLDRLARAMLKFFDGCNNGSLGSSPPPGPVSCEGVMDTLDRILRGDAMCCGASVSKGGEDFLIPCASWDVDVDDHAGVGKAWDEVVSWIAGREAASN